MGAMQIALASFPKRLLMLRERYIVNTGHPLSGFLYFKHDIHIHHPGTHWTTLWHRTLSTLEFCVDCYLELVPIFKIQYQRENLSCDVMVCMLTSTAVDCEFQTRSFLTQNYEIGICYFSARHTTISSNSKDCLVTHES